MLHVIKTVSALKEAYLFRSAQDVILLLEDAVYAANPLHHAFGLLKESNVFALEADTKARGIYHRISPSVSVIDYLGFVELTEQHPTSVTWE
ncbi:sulfurtransferase complex subunit TusB [Vibrio mangrovi]|uniref:Protein TusB n=1 Tax=Vibrio mangrovi TaxID=474394 RepID=A0A1Y6IUR4_9VIBR|nr:sulfurtransferase complex subunit TusB [Vibrio mangrovi]MDW6002075.1 sulfurtransferase complex subunit TusB [Vibrio mangrovi]SMS01417.1 Protein TusB [Vibrio mangrovi]